MRLFFQSQIASSQSYTGWSMLVVSAYQKGWIYDVFKCRLLEITCRCEVFLGIKSTECVPLRSIECQRTECNNTFILFIRILRVGTVMWYRHARSEKVLDDWWHSSMDSYATNPIRRLSSHIASYQIKLEKIASLHIIQYYITCHFLLAVFCIVLDAPKYVFPHQLPLIRYSFKPHHFICKCETFSQEISCKMAVGAG